MKAIEARVDLSKYDFSFSLSNKVARVIWNIVYWVLFRPFGLNLFKGWRLFLLKIFGAELGKNCNIYSSARIWAPWNLKLGEYSVIAPEVDCYNQGKIIIGDHTIISQKSYLCASSHDHTISNFPLILKPITISSQVWIAADAFVGPGVFIGEGALVGARASVFRDVLPWTIVGGNPSKFIKKREILQQV